MSFLPDSQAIKILLIEDNEDDAFLLREALMAIHDPMFDLKWVNRLSTGLAYLDTEEINVVLLDLNLPDSLGVDTLIQVLQHSPEVPVVILTGLDDDRLALEMMHIGAQDYLVKGQVGNMLLERTLRYAIERNRLRTQLKATSDALQSSEKRLRTIIDQNVDSIIVVSRDGYVRFANPAAESLFGQTSEALQTNCWDFLSGAQRLLKFRLLARMERRAYRNAGDRNKWEGEAAYLATLRDITERKRAEALIQTAERESGRSHRAAHRRTGPNVGTARTGDAVGQGRHLGLGCQERRPDLG